MNYQKGILVNREGEWEVFDLQYYIDAYQVLLRTKNVELSYDKFIQNVLKALDQNDVRIRCNRVELDNWEYYEGENPHKFIRDYQLKKLSGDQERYEVLFKFHRDTWNTKLKYCEFVTLHS